MGLKLSKWQTIGKIIRPKFYFHFNYVKDVALHYLKLFVLQRVVPTHTQAYFATKK
jgi:hypothetical protein